MVKSGWRITRAIGSPARGVSEETIQFVYQQFLSTTLNLEAWGSLCDRLQITAVIVDTFAYDHQVLGVVLCASHVPDSYDRLELAVVMPENAADGYQNVHQFRIDERGGLPSHVSYHYCTRATVPTCAQYRQIVYDRDGVLSTNQ